MMWQYTSHSLGLSAIINNLSIVFLFLSFTWRGHFPCTSESDGEQVEFRYIADWYDVTAMIRIWQMKNGIFKAWRGNEKLSMCTFSVSRTTSWKVHTTQLAENGLNIYLFFNKQFQDPECEAPTPSSTQGNTNGKIYRHATHHKFSVATANHSMSTTWFISPTMRSFNRTNHI